MILVAGATGTVGRHLVLELKIRQAPIRVLTRDPLKARALLGPVECAVGELGRPETLVKALAGVETAFLLSPLDPELPSWEASFARTARKAGLKRLVKLSALVADDPRSPSALLRWHAEAEQEVKRAGTPFVLLRPAAFYQNLFPSADSILRGTLSAPMGSARVAMVDARDVAAAAAAALTSPELDGKTLTLTGPAALTYAEVAEILSRVLGKPVAYSPAAPKDAERGMLSAGMPAWMTDALLGLAAEFRAGRANLVSDGVFTATGKAPTSLESFVRDHAATFA